MRWSLLVVVVASALTHPVWAERLPDDVAIPPGCADSQATGRSAGDDLRAEHGLTFVFDSRLIGK